MQDARLKTYQHVATISEPVSEANVKTRLHRARLMLRTQLEHV